MNEDREIREERDELGKEFPLLFGLEKKNPFSAPEGYFEEAEQNLSILAGAIHKAPDLDDVPENYFEELEGRIRNSLQLESIKENSFVLPGNYFEDLEANVHRKLFLEKLKGESFSTPVNYFEESAKLLRVQAWLAGYRDATIFSLPGNYFETFESRLRKRMQEGPGAKIVPLGTFSRTLKYLAAAAVFIGVCIMTYFLFQQAPVSLEENIQLSAVDKKKVIENPGAFGIDEDAVVELLQQNPELLATDADVTELSEDAMNEIVLDKEVDVSTLIGDN